MTDLVVRIVMQLLPTLLVVALVVGILWFERRRQKYSPFVERFLRPPGHSLGHKLDELREKLMMYLFATLIIGLVSSLALTDLKTVMAKFVVVLFMLLVTSYFLLRIRTVFKDGWRIKLGYEGELYVGQELNLLMRHGALVFHDVPYKYGNIDHIVISTGGVFTVETKAVRKPAKKKGRAESRVSVQNGVLHFPHLKSSQPLAQALRHADYLSEFLRAQLGLKINVMPIVALPGWYVDSDRPLHESTVMVVNPKRGQVLANMVKRDLISEKNIDLIAARIEPFSRTIQSSSDIMDPDAFEKYDFWNNRRTEEPKL